MYSLPEVLQVVEANKYTWRYFYKYFRHFNFSKDQCFNLYWSVIFLFKSRICYDCTIFINPLSLV